MKSVFITYDQANEELVLEALSSSLCRGFTKFNEVCGKGSLSGDPHMGSHAWPSLNGAVISICPDERVKPLLTRLQAIDKENPMLGLRAFVWNIEESI